MKQYQKISIMKPRTQEQIINQILNYIIDHPNCHKRHIIEQVSLSNRKSSDYILDLNAAGYIKYYHIKSLRRNDKLIVITRKGIEYARKQEEK